MIVETYIIRTNTNEFYCGKTNNLLRRIKEHSNEKKPYWFGFKDRKQIKNIYVIEGDVEKKIKSFGINKFIYISNNIKEVKVELSPLS